MKRALAADLTVSAGNAAVGSEHTKVTPMLDTNNSAISTEAVDFLACEVLRDLYRAYCGSCPIGVRAYRDDDALLLLLRFESDEQGGTDELDPTVATALRAMPAMIASAVEARSGARLAPGNLSMCSARGLAVFAFSVEDDDVEESADEDLFRIEAVAGGALRLAS